MIQCKTSKEIGGMGHSLKRKEDARFIRGQGKYTDDVNLPGMLYMAIVRSPYAYAKIKSINSEAALELPGVLAVITGKDLEQYNLHWMPTLMSDTQMVLPTDTVMYQSQEVAAVIATDRYTAADGVEAVTVEYEQMKPVIDPHRPSMRTPLCCVRTKRARPITTFGIGKLATANQLQRFSRMRMWWFRRRCTCRGFMFAPSKPVVALLVSIKPRAS